jgi:serine/threonine protein kinase
MTRPKSEARSHGGGGAGALLMLNGHGNGNGHAADDAEPSSPDTAAIAAEAPPPPPRRSKDDSALPSSEQPVISPSKRLTRGPSLFFEIVTESDDKVREEKIRRSMDEQRPTPTLPVAPSASRPAAALPPRPPSQQQRGPISSLPLSSLGNGSASANGASPPTSLGGSLSLAQRSSLFAPSTTAFQPAAPPPRLPPSTLAIAAAQAAAQAQQGPTMTPDEVLQELLGDLYIDPSRLDEQQLLGEGGFAAVHAATLAPPGGGRFGGADPENSSSSFLAPLGGGEPVAVKRLRPDALAGPEELKEFLAEANLLRKMRHPHVVALRGVGSRDLSDFIAMRRSMYVVQERMDAGDLRALVQAQAAHPFRRVYTKADALRWARQVASAVHYLHGVCRPMVIHRDLKLDNVLLATPDRGLARSAETGGDKQGAADSAVASMSAAAAAAEAARGGEPVTGEWTAKLADFGLHKRLRRRVVASGAGMQQQQAQQSPSQQWVAWDSAGPSYKGNDFEASFYGANLYSMHGGGGGAFASLQQQAALAAAANRRMAAERALAAERSAGGGGADAGGRSLEALARDASVRRRAEALRAIEDGSVHGGGRAASAHSGEIAPAVAAAIASAASSGPLPSPSGGGGGGGGAAPIDATTRVGSLLYMAPEVLRGEPYNEKVDVFSFAVMLFELFSGKPLANRIAAAAEQQAAAGDSSSGGKGKGGNNNAPHTVVVLAGGGADPGEQGTLLAYAQRVAAGHREDLPPAWPRALRALISACWHADPQQRPSFAEIVRSLDALRDSGAIEEMDAAAQCGLRTDYDPLNDCGCGCSIM